MLNHNNSYRVAVVALVIACSVWGTAFLFGKLAFTELTVSQVVLYRFGLASLALLPIALLRRAWPQPQDLPLFVVTGFLTVPVTFLLQFGGLSLTSVASASLIIGAFPPLLALAAAGFYHEKLGTRGWAAVGASTLGVLLIVGLPGPDHNWLGDALVFLSLITSVAWVLLSKRLIERYSALIATGYVLTFGTLTLLPISLFWDGLPRLSLSGGVWGSVLALGLVSTAFTFMVWNWGLERVPASQAGVYVNLEPVVGAVLGVTVLQEVLGPGALLGGLLIVAAAWIISQPEEPRQLTASYPLKKLPLFHNLGRRHLGLIAQHVDVVRLEAGRVLARQGERAQEFLIILEGSARVEWDGKLTTRLGAGDFFGEVSLIDKKPQPATVIAETPIVLLVSHKRDFNYLLDMVPGLQGRMLVTLCKRLREIDMALSEAPTTDSYTVLDSPAQSYCPL